jgi:hypothetical protein
VNGTPFPPSSARKSGPGQERGFALLTVIVIVMALTILGLSLFSLSGFEARFFRPAVNQAQAIQSGRAGVDWARYVLESTDDLGSVRIARPPEWTGITGVIARRGPDFDSGDSTGYVFPAEGVDPDSIWVRAVASQGNQESAVMAMFSPSPGQDIYKRLMTVMDKMVIKRDNDAERFGNTLLTGIIRMRTVRIEDYNGDEITTPLHGTNCVGQQNFHRPEEDLGQGAGWWSEKYNAPGTQDLIPVPGSPITIGPTGSQPAIYRTDLNEMVGGPPRLWSAGLEDDECIINVRGTLIWMFPDGLLCTDQLRFHNIGSGEATVIMVSRPGPDVNGGKENDVGFALLGGLNIPSDVNVFMISTGCVEIEHFESEWETAASDSRYLSIYADWVRLMGPTDDDDKNMDLKHGDGCNANDPNDLKDGLVDQLIEANLLPNSRFARRKLAFVPGTWNENPTSVGN